MSPAATTATAAAADRHLDLGCGRRPRNPYQRQHLCGVDIRPLSATPEFEYRTANLVVAPIPWPDNSFASVSAFDFLEHVPRLVVLPDGSGTRFPFIELLDEVWRVLAPGGRLYALTPAYPSPQAFQDPTHVNIITDQTHTYFCGERPLGRIYGFQGRFEALRVGWVDQATHFTAVPGTPPARPMTPSRRFAHAVRDGVRRLRGRPVEASQHVYLLWEWQALK